MWSKSTFGYLNTLVDPFHPIRDYFIYGCSLGLKNSQRKQLEPFVSWLTAFVVMLDKTLMATSFLSVSLFQWPLFSDSNCDRLFQCAASRQPFSLKQNPRSVRLCIVADSAPIREIQIIKRTTKIGSIQKYVASKQRVTPKFDTSQCD